MPLIPPAPAYSATADEPKGVVYTKRWVVDLLLDLAGYCSTRNLVDSVAVEPSAGEGAFLLPMAERLLDSCDAQNRPYMQCCNSLAAFEIDERSALNARTKVREFLLNRAIPPAEAEQLAVYWIRIGDYLLESHTLSADYVIGNPPYIRLEEIPDEITHYYREIYPTMVGRADLYVAFFEASLRSLTPNGVCAFICADRWMRNQYGAQLRELITTGFSVDCMIDMHQVDAFHSDVDAYPAVTIIRRGQHKHTLVVKTSADTGKFSANDLNSSYVNHLTNPSKPSRIRATLIDSWFQGTSPWSFASPQQLNLLRYLEEHFPPLESSAKLGIGVATGNDKLFITKDPNLVESSRLMKLAIAKDLSSGTVQWSGNYLVNPWDQDGLVNLEEFPVLKMYFEKHSKALRKRHTAIKNSHAWYRTIDRVSLELSNKPKLYIADIKNSLEPVFDAGYTYPHHNLYYIESSQWDLEVLGGLLLSALGLFFVHSYGVRMRGGYYRFQAQYLRRIRIPAPHTVSVRQKQELKDSFRTRDRDLATKIALQVYGITATQLEDSLEVG